MSEAPSDYLTAKYLNEHPEDLEQFFDEAVSLKTIANVFDMLKGDVRARAVKIASRMVIKMAKQIADTGYRSGKLKMVKGSPEEGEFELDRSLEAYIEQPELGIVNNMVSYKREKEGIAFVVIIDHSYSMRGLKIFLAAITAATIAFHFKRDYAVMAFSSEVSVIKALRENVSPEVVLKKLFDLPLRGDTDVRKALKEGLTQVSKSEHKKGLVLTDGAWNSGGSPQEMAGAFEKLNVLCFPPANPDKVRLLAQWGRGEFAFVENEQQIAAGIIKCLG